MVSQSNIQRFEDLIVWKKAMSLSEEICRVSRCGGFLKDWGLRDQVRRSSVSIPSNIAEGFGRFSCKDFKHFLAVANGSANELRTQVRWAANLNYFDQATAGYLVEKCLEVSRMIKGLRTRVK